MIFILIFILKTIEAFTSTISTLLIVEEKRLYGSILSFIQVIIWFLIIKFALEENGVLIVLSYASGYSLGSYLASFVTTCFSKKKLLVIIITNKRNILSEMKRNGYSASIVKGDGLYGNKNLIIFSFINGKRKNKLISIIKKIDNKAFIVINQNKELINGYFKHSNDI